MPLDKQWNVLYDVLHMLQIVSITDARNNLAKLINKIQTTKQPVVIVQDSSPSVVIYPYNEIAKQEEERDQLFKLKFQEIFAEGKKSFKKYLQAKSKKAPRSEDKAYSIIKNA
ncbi:MAG: Antitoxin [Candidatus Levybacteria bacterium]|nr:Antitoxin [Candidatus Levybacteria bacterium]